MAFVDISGVTKIKVRRLENHPNDGIWLELYDRKDTEIFISVWIPYKQIGIFFSVVAQALLNVEPEEKLEFLLEKESDAPSVEAKTI